MFYPMCRKPPALAVGSVKLVESIKCEETVVVREI